MKAFQKFAYALLRFAAGACFAIHGLPILFGLLGGPRSAMFSQIWFGGVIMLVCGPAIALGFRTRWAAFLASGTMAVAYVQFHWHFALGRNLIPMVNHGEPALLFCVIFAYLATVGNGSLSLGKGEN